MMALRRVAIYGGTFDPVHNGHIEVARRVLELFELDEVIFVPACVPPHKRTRGISSAFHRFAMLALATEDDERLRISTIELDEPERPYAVDTVARMHEMSADSRLFFMIGGDSWSEITTWHEWQRLLKMCDLIVVTRPGYELSANVPATEVVDVRGMSRQKISGLLASDSGPRTFLTDAAIVDVSATRIRATVQANTQSNAQADDLATLKEMVPLEVANYIKKYELYKN
jgi:nicotinate-nucleotide adenylyltransferase